VFRRWSRPHSFLAGSSPVDPEPELFGSVCSTDEGVGLAVRGRPAAPALRQVEEPARAWTDALEVREHLVAASIGDAPFLRVAAMEGDDDVVLIAAAQRISARPPPGTIPSATGSDPPERLVPAPRATIGTRAA